VGDDCQSFCALSLEVEESTWRFVSCWLPLGAWHRSDYGKAPSEDAVMDALRKFGIAPGDYMIPGAV
jgi:hypothetical protein